MHQNLLVSLNSLFSKNKVEFCNEMHLDYQKIKKNYLKEKPKEFHILRGSQS